MTLACRPAPVVVDEDAEPFPQPAIAFAPRSYAAARAEPAPVLDGRLDDPAWRRAPWTAEFVDIVGPSGASPRLRTRAKMLWDDVYFYVAADLEEPDLWATLTERDAVIYRDNDFEVFIDPDGDTHEYYEVEINALGTVWDLFLVRPYRDGGPAIHAWDIAGLQTAVHLDGTLNRPGDTDRGWTVELALPWAVLREAAHRPSPPNPGDRWRVNFSRVQWQLETRDGRYVKRTDAAGEALPEDNWVWSPQGLVNMHYPEMWGIVEFVAGSADSPRVDIPLETQHRVEWLLRRVYYRERAFFARHRRFTSDLAILAVSREPDLPWPPRITATSTWFEASLYLSGDTVTIAADGRLR